MDDHVLDGFFQIVSEIICHTLDCLSHTEKKGDNQSPPRTYKQPVSYPTGHQPREGDPSGRWHFGSNITPVPSPQYCKDCHAQEVEEYSRSKHAWAAFMGPLKPYYLKAKADGLDPFSQDTAKLLDPELMAKTALSPLFPDSGILARIGLLDDPTYHHNNVNLGCMECHGSFINTTESLGLVALSMKDVVTCSQQWTTPQG